MRHVEKDPPTFFYRIFLDVSRYLSRYSAIFVYSVSSGLS